MRNTFKNIRAYAFVIGVMLLLAGCNLVEKGEDFDLSTTYFPFGLGYIWTYELYEYHMLYPNESGKYDTVSIWVRDSTYDSNGWSFGIDREDNVPYGPFQDIGSYARIFEKDSEHFVQVDIEGYKDTIGIVPERESDCQGCFNVSYFADTLKIVFAYYLFPYDYDHSTWRVKGIGVIKQSYYEGYVKEATEYTYRLLYFYNGQDTVYKAND